MSTNNDQHDNGSQVHLPGADVELIVNGSVYLAQAPNRAVEVRRGMAMMTVEGHEAGSVAGVVMTKQSQRMTHVLLSRLAYRPEYRLVPIDLVQEVREERVLLRIFNHVVSNLPAWQGLEPDSPNPR